MRTISRLYDTSHPVAKGVPILLYHQKNQAMKLFQLSFDKLLIRFYLIMLVIIVAGFTGLWWLAILALPIFFTALMGMTLARKVTVKHTKQIGQQDAAHRVEQVTGKI